MLKPSNILIFGAPGSGVSTLVNNLADQLKWPVKHLVVKHTPPDSGDPIPIDKTEFLELRSLLSSNTGHLIEGSPCLQDWDLQNIHRVIYIRTPRITRLQRLREREIKLQGQKILEEGLREFKVFNRFMYWVSQFDQAGVDRQSKILHQNFLTQLKVPLLEANGLLGEQEILTECLEWLNQE